ncbi:MAG TPA: FMN-binding negative transcriptional regulator [Pirellulales bacterium]|nr:FMN-binding negative transcriptional regulator [Pirellulales bacterium]
MYIPASFEQLDPDELQAFIERHSFAALVSQHDGQPLASQLPLHFKPDCGEQGCLVGHMARANPQWRQADGQTVLAMFTGPHAYISASWYEAQNVVPTWNYAAVHIYGRFEAIHDTPALLAIVREFVEFYESGRSEPWQLPDDEFIERLTESIVGFHIPIDRIEGKWKLSQNQPAERRQKVIAALERRSDENSRAVAALMRSKASGGH